MTNLTLDVNIIDFPSIPVAMLPHRCSPELLNYSVAKFIMWRKETGLSPVNQSQTFGVAWDEEVTSNAVEVHVHHLRRKLGSDFIRTVHGIGYTLGEK